MRIYIKSEPSGEYFMGKVPKEVLEEYGIIGDNEFNPDFEAKTLEYDNVFHVFGIAPDLYDGGSGMLGVSLSEKDEETFFNNSTIKEVAYQEDYSDEVEEDILEGLDEGYYICCSMPSKYSADFDIDIDEDDFNIELLECTFEQAKFPERVEDFYGGVDLLILTSISYDGKNYDDELTDSLVDRGYETQMGLIKVNADKTYEVIH